MSRFILFVVAVLVWSCQASPEAPVSTDLTLASDSIATLPLQALPLFEDAPGKFSIYFPTPPQRSTYNSEVDIGNVAMTQWITRDAAGQFYVLSYADYPEAVLRLGSDKQLLRGVEERLLAALHAQQPQRQALLLDSLHTGVAFYAQAKRRHWHLYYHLYLVDQRLYQLGIHSAIGPISTQDSLDFFGSFELLE